jgi:hypothetical protein
MDLEYVFFPRQILLKVNRLRLAQMRRIETVLVEAQEPCFMCRLDSIFVEIWTLGLELKNQLAMNFLVYNFCIKWIRTLNCGRLDSGHVSLLLIMYAFYGTWLLLFLIPHLRGLAGPHGLSPLPDLPRCEEIRPNCLLHEVFTGSSI